jgi:(2Fe-2S) ferredoxin
MKDVNCIHSLQDLIQVKQENQETIAGFRYRLLVCGGAGCISSNCRQVQEILHRTLKEKGLSHCVQVVETGCIGTCDLGPVLIVMPDGVFYSRLSPADIPLIVSTHLVEGKIVMDKTYFNRESGQHIPYVCDIPYFSRQVKIALRNCGSIDHASLAEYIGRDGYMAAAKVLLEMSAEETVRKIQKAGLRGRGGAGFRRA